MDNNAQKIIIKKIVELHDELKKAIAMSEKSFAINDSHLSAEIYRIESTIDCLAEILLKIKYANSAE